MHETSAPPEGATSETWRLRWDVVGKRCEELGAVSRNAQAQLMGVPRTTFFRWLKGTHTPNLTASRRAADRLDLPSDEMWERAA
ncbi:hypothetical protein MED01_004230 [Micromonospora sp. MED01]|uniref:hypothetical protein n=1 Tax=Micromonospora alfalfae TaxID=2911212 RepID=UPI001EE95E7B|nr:hypothetical protein [Micromonospora alfalfae]MCG5460804.1 hypothetical protein [Micromonospora alfalfae]